MRPVLFGAFGGAEMTECKHDWQISLYYFNPDGDMFFRARCKHCQMALEGDEINRRINAAEKLSATGALRLARMVRREWLGLDGFVQYGD